MLATYFLDKRVTDVDCLQFVLKLKKKSSNKSISSFRRVRAQQDLAGNHFRNTGKRFFIPRTLL